MDHGQGEYHTTEKLKVLNSDLRECQDNLAIRY